jgi:H+/Na+-translocating ferredoxin:NAD+ oxidoreductase subunit D
MGKEEEKKPDKILIVSSSPHLVLPSTSRGIMFEVLIGCLPATLAAIYFFRGQAALVLIACVASALITEWLFNVVRKKPVTIGDGSAIITAVILGLSLPPTMPTWAAAIGTITAISVGKMLFGGLGSNIFNPAMMGRAFLMACFGTMMTTWTLPVQDQLAMLQMRCCAGQKVMAVTEATPLAMAKQPIKDAANDNKIKKATPTPVNQKLKAMLLGKTSGSLGETSALCWLIGGMFLLFRRTITWHIPAAVLGSAMFFATIPWLLDSFYIGPSGAMEFGEAQVYANPLVHLFGGGLMMCAFFIATDPVTCPLTRGGRILFGIGVGSLIMLIRLKGGYPEGVMYAILLMNAMAPLLERWTRPKPMGGHSS